MNCNFFTENFFAYYNQNVRRKENNSPFWPHLLLYKKANYLYPSGLPKVYLLLPNCPFSFIFYPLLLQEPVKLDPRPDVLDF